MTSTETNLYPFVIGCVHCYAAEVQNGRDGDICSAVQNPISALISLPFKYTFDYGATNGDATILNIQPVIPVTVGDWNYGLQILKRTR